MFIKCLFCEQLFQVVDVHDGRRLVDSVIQEPLPFTALVLEDDGEDALRLAVVIAVLVSKCLLLFPHFLLSFLELRVKKNLCVSGSAPLFALGALVKRSRVEIFTYKFLKEYIYLYLYLYL